jgi:hypothetical protein
MKMEYNVQVLRGWPYEGALDRVETIKSGSTFSNGDWVIKDTDNTVIRATTAATNRAGLVIRGNGDSGSAAYTGKALVLWGNFIAQIKNLPAATTFVPGTDLTIKWNNSTVSPAYLAVANGTTDPVVGVVLDVIAASSTNDASVVALFR